MSLGFERIVFSWSIVSRKIRRGELSESGTKRLVDWSSFMRVNGMVGTRKKKKRQACGCYPQTCG